MLPKMIKRAPIFKRILVFLTGVATLSSIAGALGQTAPLNRGLFVGNSDLYDNDGLHNHVKRMVVERFPIRSHSVSLISHRQSAVPD
jgi:ERCC4-related helicase